MTHPSDSVLSDEVIEGRTEALVKDGSLQERVERFALLLAESCSGEVAERALAKLLHALEPDRVCRLVTEHIMSEVGLTSRPDYCGSGHALLAIKLARRHFRVDSGDGWQVDLPDGTELAPMLEVVEGEDPRIRLCRLGLLGVWILTMRKRPPQTPAP